MLSALRPAQPQWAPSNVSNDRNWDGAVTCWLPRHGDNSTLPDYACSNSACVKLSDPEDDVRAAKEEAAVRAACSQ
eukprot:996914-Pleurochrysis_carterae.AAC.1